MMTTRTNTRPLAFAILSTLGCLTLSGLWSGLAEAKPDRPKDLLIKFENPEAVTAFTTMAQDGGAKIETVGTGHWLRVILNDQQLQTLTLEQIRRNPNVLAAQPNYPIRIPEDYRTHDKALRRKLEELAKRQRETDGLFSAPRDNPMIPDTGYGGSGPDPLLDKQWGLRDIGAPTAWKMATGGEPITVAVIDTGVDYTHEDLVDNLWRNLGETGLDTQGHNKATNKIDDDGNGYVDDTIGWDFVSDDNKPYDLTIGKIWLLLTGGNPGHGTHCAGNIAARANNGKGIAGVAPEAKIMALRFLGERGQGTTAGAIKAIDYAVKMGAKVLSNSWGSEGEGLGGQNLALREAIQAAEKAGVLFVAAAGNGHSGRGYDNDTDARPAYPASYPYDNIISVAAVDAKDQLGKFSNWGPKSVDIAAPGVAVFSTTVPDDYADAIIKIFGWKFTWDGTSMAAPHVAGAAALYWSMHPTASWQEVKAAILTSAKPIPSITNKIVSGGKLNVETLMTP